MSREIKFRAWIESVLPEENGLYYPKVMQIGEDGLVDKFWTDDYKFTGDTCKFTLMQFTGHQSIDEVNVYEGDLLKFPGTDDQHYLVKWLDETGQWGIMFGKTVFNLQMGTIGLAQFMQIAGNIYEDKELLK